MFLTAVWILCKSSLVEGVLDGSILSDGKAVPVKKSTFVFFCTVVLGNSKKTPRNLLGKMRGCLVLGIA